MRCPDSLHERALVLTKLVRRGHSLAAVALAAGLAGALPRLAPETGVVVPGNAVLTGFSGYIAKPAPPSEDPFDYLTIDLDGPAAQVVDLSVLGPKGQLSDALKTFAIPAAFIGQVFGVVLDDAPSPSV